MADTRDEPRRTFRFITSPTRCCARRFRIGLSSTWRRSLSSRRLHLRRAIMANRISRRVRRERRAEQSFFSALSASSARGWPHNRHFPKILRQVSSACQIARRGSSSRDCPPIIPLATRPTNVCLPNFPNHGRMDVVDRWHVPVSKEGDALMRLPPVQPTATVRDPAHGRRLVPAADLQGTPALSFLPHRSLSTAPGSTAPQSGLAATPPESLLLEKLVRSP